MIQTKRLQLIEMDESHIDHLYALLQTKGMTDHIWDIPDSKDAFFNQIKQSISIYTILPDIGFWMIFLPEQKEFIGRIGMVLQPLNDQMELELNYLISPNFQHQGYAKEAAQAIIESTFKSQEPMRIISLIAQSNTAAKALANSLGMSKTEEIQHPNGMMDIYSLQNPNL